MFDSVDSESLGRSEHSGMSGGRAVRVLARDAHDLADRLGLPLDVAARLWKDADRAGRVVRAGRIKRGELGAPPFLWEIVLPAATVAVGILTNA